MKIREKCPHCGQSIMKHTHIFNKSLATILLKTAKRFSPGEPFHLQKDLDLTKNEYANFQKLRYWKFVEKFRFNGKRKGGYWRLTDFAVQVLNKGSIPRSVITFNNTIVEESEEYTSISDAIGYFETPEKWSKRSIVMTREVQPVLF